MSADKEQPYDAEDHITTSFVMDEVSVDQPCPSGAAHNHELTYLPAAVALCVCDWAYVQSFHHGWPLAVVTMEKTAAGKAQEHMDEVAKGLM